jgi:hypothetical protein
MMQKAVRGCRCRTSYAKLIESSRRQLEAVLKIQAQQRKTAAIRLKNRLTAKKVAQQRLRAMIQGWRIRQTTRRTHSSNDVKAAMLSLSIRREISAQRETAELFASTVMSSHVSGHSARTMVMALRSEAESSAKSMIVAAALGCKTRTCTGSLRSASEKHAESVLGAVAKGFSARREISAQHEAANRAMHLRRVASVKVIQQAYRVRLCARYASACVIQRSWNRYISLKRLALLVAAKAIVSRCLRAKLQRRAFLRIKQSISCIQRVVRQHQIRRACATVIVQKVVRGYFGYKQALKRQRAIVAIQATWRGSKARTSCSKKMVEVRKRLQEATANVQEHLKLGNRTSWALDVLLNQKQITFLIQALGHLDITTRFSAKCTARLVAQDGVSIIVELMRNCNRSKPHQELLKLAVNILGNIALSPYLIPALYRSDHTAEVLLDLMQNFRDTPSIFMKCSGTLIKICNTKDGHQKVTSLVDAKKRIKGILSLIQKKLDMEKKQAAMKGNKKSNTMKHLIAAVENVKTLHKELNRD